MQKLTFGTKAQTLEKLQKQLRHAAVLPLQRVALEDWQNRRDQCLDLLLENEWAKGSLIVRSSAKGEDSLGSSQAGKYLSLAQIEGRTALNAAIDAVFASYANWELTNEVFVQPMLLHSRFSGVAFSREPNSGAPYIVLNYDDISGSTSSVTAGRSNELKTFYYFRDSEVELPPIPRQVIPLILELESLFDNSSIDVEFAADQNGKLYLFQVRPLHAKANFEADERQHLQEIEKKLNQLNRPHPHLLGTRTLFGIMPDWNPAEIIGVRPRPLSLSMYREIVTDSIWAYQRDNYGYRNVRSFPLLFSFAGLPYIDVRASFNSFLPSKLRPELGERLVNEYIDRLYQSPELHDKVEFEIVFSCYTLDINERIKRLSDEGFSKGEVDEIVDSLRSLTNQIINPETGLWKKDIEKNSRLKERQERILSSDLDKVSKIYWLLEDCKRYGTLPFAGLARAAFIAVQFLKSLNKVGILSTQDFDNFLGSLNTVGSQLTADFLSLDKNSFLKKYGHLRPGTYDILSPRYDETPDRYFQWDNRSAHGNQSARFSLTIDQLKSTEKKLAENGLNYTAIGLFDFIKQAIEGREWSKFVFSKSVSDVLVLVRELCEELGFSAEDASFVDIQDVIALYHSSWDQKERIRKSIERGKRLYAVSERINLPPLIRNTNEVWAFHLPKNDPNFVTKKRVSGRVVGADVSTEFLKDSIVLIPSADPGYDWLFSHNIAGFITMYGGANSHMAIRSAELGIPAVIGAGEALYKQWSTANYLELECSNRKVTVLK